MIRTSDLPAEKTDLANPDLGPQVWIIQAQGLDWDPNPDLANPDLGPANPDLGPGSGKNGPGSGFFFSAKTRFGPGPDLGLEKTDLGLEKADLANHENPDLGPWVWKKQTLRITKIQTSDLGLEKTDPRSGFSCKGPT